MLDIACADIQLLHLRENELEEEYDDKNDEGVEK